MISFIDFFVVLTRKVFFDQQLSTILDQYLKIRTLIAFHFLPALVEQSLFLIMQYRTERSLTADRTYRCIDCDDEQKHLE